MDQRELQELSPQEALRLLADAAMGRVVFTQRALPAVRVVNHIVDNGDLIIRTNVASSVAASVGRTPDTVVAYEADAIDPGTRTGWSVVITGVARLVEDPQDVARYEALLEPWVTNRADCVLRIHPEIITGFRLTPSAV